MSVFYELQNDISVLKDGNGDFPETIVYDAGQAAKVEYIFENGLYQWFKDGEFIDELDVYDMLMTIERSYSKNPYKDKRTGRIILEQ